MRPIKGIQVLLGVFFLLNAKGVFAGQYFKQIDNKIECYDEAKDAPTAKEMCIHDIGCRKEGGRTVYQTLRKPVFELSLDVLGDLVSSYPELCMSSTSSQKNLESPLDDCPPKEDSSTETVHKLASSANAIAEKCDEVKPELEQVRRLGKGGAKEVFLYKVLNHEQTDYPEEVAGYSVKKTDKPLIHEISLQRKLVDVPGVVRSLGLVPGKKNTKIHLIEYFKDGTLSKYAAPNKKRPEKMDVVRVLSSAKQLCGTLSGIHSKNIVNRDIKPDNMFLSSSRVAIGDFGEGYEFKNVSKENRESYGTPTYLSPEYVRNLKENKLDSLSDVDLFSLDKRRDQWALGVSLLNIAAQKEEKWQPDSGNDMGKIFGLAKVKQVDVNQSIDSVMKKLKEEFAVYNANLDSQRSKLAKAKAKFESTNSPLDRFQSFLECALNVQGVCKEFEKRCQALE